MAIVHNVYDLILRREDVNVLRRVLELEVEGQRKKAGQKVSERGRCGGNA